MARLTLTHLGREVAVIDLGPGDAFGVDYRDGAGTVTVLVDGVAAPPIAEAVVLQLCRDCDTELDDQARHPATREGDGAAACAGTVEVELRCPHCASEALAEINVAEVWSPIEDVTPGAGGAVTVEVDSPVYGDWEGAGWVCTACHARCTLPARCHIEYR